MRLDVDRQKELEPERMKYARKQIESLGYEIIFSNDKSFSFKFKGEIVMFFPYSGWHTGKTIKDGRGITKLLKQIKLKA